jgi:hypothetical protein
VVLLVFVVVVACGGAVVGNVVGVGVNSASPCDIPKCLYQ